MKRPSVEDLSRSQAVRAGEVPQDTLGFVTEAARGQHGASTGLPGELQVAVSTQSRHLGDEHGSDKVGRCCQEDTSERQLQQVTSSDAWRKPPEENETRRVAGGKWWEDMFCETPAGWEPFPSGREAVDPAKFPGA